MAGAGFTQDDVDRLRTLIASGVKSVRYDGPPGRSLEYHSLPEALALLDRMVAEVAGNTGARLSYRRAAIKGFNE